jgi:uncharacterized membrane protein
MPFSENPMIAVSQMRAQREQTFLRETLLLCFLPSIGFVLGRACVVVFALQLGITLLLVPYSLASCYSSFLTGLRRSGCIEEVMGTRTSMTALSEGCVLVTLQHLWRSGLLLLGLIDGLILKLMGLPLGIALALFWPVVLILLTVAWSYFFQLGAAWTSSESTGSRLAPLLARTLVVTAGAAMLVTLFSATQSWELCGLPA